MQEKILRLDLVEGANFSSKYELPTLDASYFKPDLAIPFDRIRKSSNHDTWVYFFVSSMRWLIDEASLV